VPSANYSGTVPKGGIADEGPLAAQIVAMYSNIEHVLVRSNARSPLEALDRYFSLFDRPALNICNHVWGNVIMDAAKEKKLTVMLEGGMGNMTTSYAGIEALPDMLAQGRLLAVGRKVLQLAKQGNGFKYILSQTLGPFVPASAWLKLNEWNGQHLKLGDYSSVNPAKAAGLQAEAASDGLDLSYRPRRDPFGTRLWALRRVDPGNYIKGHLGGWGIDMRDPTADRRLIELCLSIPPGEFIRDGEARSIARRAFADRLPRSVIKETRRGRQSLDWHEGLAPAREEAAAEVDRIASIPSGRAVLDVEQMKHLVQNWPEADWDSGRVQANYRFALLRGISVGHFLRKASGSNS
jgi:asparagine synthase (glutamine-hydrolysing)